jgi:hypothetical protein
VSQFSYLVLPGGREATAQCGQCGWRLPAAPISPFDPAETMIAAEGEHRACPGTISPATLVDQAADLLRRANDCFLPAHTRDHVLAALDLLVIARDELRRADDDAPCLVGQGGAA